MSAIRQSSEQKKKNSVPIYTYRCEACEVVFDIHHSMKEMREDCEECGSKETLTRIPSIPFIDKGVERSATIGSLVRKHIEEGKEELKKEKQEMKMEIEVEPKND